MNTKIKNKKEQIVDSFVDSGAEAVIEWGNEFIKTNVPKSLDWISSNIKGVFSSLASKSDLSLRENVRKAIFAGIEVGEENKEQALIQAMKVEGIDEKKIKLILDESKQFLITFEEIQEISKQ